MAGKSILRLSTMMVAALVAISVIGCSKSAHKDKGQKTFDKDLVGYWAPAPKDGNSPEQDSGAEGSDVPRVIQIDPNGDVFGFDEVDRKFVKIGVIQANGAILFSPEVSKNNESVPISFVLSKIDINSIKAVGTGPESSESGSGKPVGNQKSVEKEFYFKRLTQSQQDEFNKALAAKTQTNDPSSTGVMGASIAATGTCDVDFVGHWVALSPYENPYQIQSGAEISDDAPIFRVDQNGQVFVYQAADDIHEGAKPPFDEDRSIGVVQASGEILLTPEFSKISSIHLMVLIKDRAGQVHLRLVNAQLDSDGATAGRPQDESEDLKLIKLTEDQFKKAVEKRTKKITVGGETAEEPAEVVAADEEDSQVESADNEELEPSPRIPTIEGIEIDPITWEARAAILDFMLR